MKEIKFSIIIPYFNTKAEYFIECLESVKNQIYKNIQIIIINNSTIEYKDILKPYGKLNNFVIIEEEDKGVSYARNKGITIADGEYILFLDADDWLLDDTCLRLNEIINKNDFPDIVIGKSFMHQANNVVENVSQAFEGMIQDKQKLIDSIFLNYNNLYSSVEVPWAKAYKKEFLLQNNINFDIKLSNGEDVVFNYEAYKQAKNIFYTTQVIYNYRFNPFSVCASFCPDLDKKFETLSKVLHEKIDKYKSVEDLQNLYCYNIRNICRLLRKFYNKSSNYKTFKQNFVNLLKLDEFKQSLSNVKLKHLDKDKKLIVILCRLKMYIILYKMSKKGFKIK